MVTRLEEIKNTYADCPGWVGQDVWWLINQLDELSEVSGALVEQILRSRGGVAARYWSVKSARKLLDEIHNAQSSR